MPTGATETIQAPETRATAKGAAVRPGRRLAAPAVVAVALAVGLAAAALGWPAGLPQRVEGWAAFHGHLDTPARIVGHSADLPALASRCAGCHDEGDRVATRRPIARLDADRLSRPVVRRGGPPVVFDEMSFCRALRDGVDPAGVVIDRVMPRFRITDERCRALWIYVSTR